MVTCAGHITWQGYAVSGVRLVVDSKLLIGVNVSANGRLSRSVSPATVQGVPASRTVKARIGFSSPHETLNWISGGERMDGVAVAQEV